MNDAIRELKKLRRRIDRADEALLKALGARMAVAVEIGKLKAKHGLPLLQKARWLELLEDRIARGRRLSLTPRFTHAVLRAIHGESLRIQRLFQPGRKR